MGREPLPVYREHGRTYHADNCAPLVNAAREGHLLLRALGRGAYPGGRLGAGALPGLRSLGVWDAPTRQAWGLDWHRNEGIELTMLESGRLAFRLGGAWHRLRPGQVTITRPWQPHRLGHPHIEAGRLVWLILDVGVRQPHQAWRWPDWLLLAREEKDELSRYLRQNEQPVWDATPDLAAAFRKLGRSIPGASEPIPCTRLELLINETLVNLLDLFRQCRPRLQRSLTAARRSVELFLRGLPSSLAEPWTLPSMASACRLGVTRFVHYCREITNRTPMEHLRRLRLEAAAGRMRQAAGGSVTDVALDLGFSSSQYFATVFRRHFGQAPTTVRCGRPRNTPHRL